MAGQRALLFVGAHPDDESFGPGGTLARYAAEGVRVVYACATRGEAGTVAPRLLAGFATLGDLRWAELMCAAERLGLAAVIPLGYRDSGMPGAPDNRHPRALVATALEQLSRDVLAVIRDVGAQVVITFDPIGGYRHPDHIAIHKATVQAFESASAGTTRPGSKTPFAPQKLYYWLPPRSLRLAVLGLRLLGVDPARAGRNRDVDIAGVAATRFPIHARIHVPRRAVARQHAALACHRSQLPSRALLWRLGWFVSRSLPKHEIFMRAQPRPGAGVSETDLFAGVR